MPVPTSRPTKRAHHIIGAAVYIVLALALAAALLGVAACDSSETETTESITESTTAVTTSETTVSSETTSTTSPVTEEIYPTDEIYLSTTTTTLAKLDTLTLVAPPGPMAIPMAYIAANDKLADVAKKTATVHTYMVCERSGAFNMLDKPIRFINIEFKGVSTILFSYLLVGEPQIGMRVVPVFKYYNPTYTILDLSWVPVEPGVVAEVSYDQLTGGRFRHATRFERWRPDKDASACTLGQLLLAKPQCFPALSQALPEFIWEPDYVSHG